MPFDDSEINYIIAEVYNLLGIGAGGHANYGTVKNLNPEHASQEELLADVPDRGGDISRPPYGLKEPYPGTASISDKTVVIINFCIADWDHRQNYSVRTLIIVGTISS